MKSLKARRKFSMKLDVNAAIAVADKQRAPYLTSNQYAKSSELKSSSSLAIDGVSYPASTEPLTSVKMLGQGAFGVVYRMHHTTSGIDMAVKQATKSVVGEYEIEILEQSCSDYIVAYYGCISHEGSIWICMELMSWSAKGMYMLVEQNRSRISENILAEFARSLLGGLSYLLDVLDVFHHDVKPDNILLNCRGEIKLCDFGICQKRVNANHTQLGTRKYMSPEQIHPIDASTRNNAKNDVWSLGITLVELAIGKFPYVWGDEFDQINTFDTGTSLHVLIREQASHSIDFIDFIRRATIVEHRDRADFDDLKKHRFLDRACGATLSSKFLADLSSV